jgi:hypothetical protein
VTLQVQAGGIRSAGPGDRIIVPEAEALDLALDAYPVPDSVGEGDRVTALEVEAEFLVVERPGVNAHHIEY